MTVSNIMATFGDMTEETVKTYNEYFASYVNSAASFAAMGREYESKGNSRSASEMYLREASAWYSAADIATVLAANNVFAKDRHSHLMSYVCVWEANALWYPDDSPDYNRCIENSREILAEIEALTNNSKES